MAGLGVVLRISGRVGQWGFTNLPPPHATRPRAEVECAKTPGHEEPTTMFGGRGMFDDPFFGDMHRHMRRQMAEMDNLMGSMMMDPFSMMDGRRGMSSRMLEGPRAQSRSVSEYRRDPMADLLMPFGGGILGGGGINHLIGQVDRMRETAMTDPNAHVYSHSTVVSFGPGGRDYYEATNEVRKAGDVKEVRHSVRDSVDGEERMRIGHHMGDRAHVIEKRRGRDGQIRQQQSFQGIRAEQAAQFDREWADRTRARLGVRQGRIGYSPSRRRTVDEARGSGPIITEVDDSDADPKRRRGTAGATYSSSEFRPGRKGGPVIEEVE